MRKQNNGDVSTYIYIYVYVYNIKHDSLKTTRHKIHPFTITNIQAYTITLCLEVDSFFLNCFFSILFFYFIFFIIDNVSHV